MGSIITLSIVQSALELGFIYALVALALFISFSILNIADLSTDGCFTLGCAVCASVTLAGHPILGLFAAMAAGVCSGFVTAFLQTKMGIQSIVAGIIVTVLTAVVTIGGIKSISKVAEIVVPIMALTFLGGSVVALVINRAAVPGAFKAIFTCAFAKESVIGGTAGTGVITFMTVMRTGIARGVYTNEAGLGSSPIVAAAAKTNSGVRQGLLSMTSVFVTTILTCSMTGLVIISSGLMDSSDMNGSTLVTAAYNMCLPHNIGMYLIAVGIMFFAFTTILGWNYYGERCLVYLTGTTKWIKPYKIIYIAAIALAPFLSLEPIWLLADITNALMIIPNLIAIIALRKVIIGETKLYFSKRNEEKMSAAVKAVE